MMARLRAPACALFVALCASIPLRAQPAPPPPLYRIVFTDGTGVDAYGEWVRVGDRLVFSLALDPTRDPPALHLSSVPVGRVDLEATERYRETLRAATYAATRGDVDFDALSADVARLLSDAAQATDVARKLALTEQARALLAAWPAAHHAYRLDEVRQIQALVDELIGGLRAARGDTAFDLSLVAQVMPPPSVPLAPMPTLRDTIAQALGLSRMAETPAERMSLLRAARALVGDRATRPPLVDRIDDGAIDQLAREVTSELTREMRLDATYASLKARVLGEAMRAASRADVRAVERAASRARARDEALGHQRPDVMRDVVASLDRYLDTARQLRLARDQWTTRKSAIAGYRDRVAPLLRALHKARGALDDVRTFAGPSTKVLSKTEAMLREADAQLRHMVAPVEAGAAQAVVQSALQLAANAVRLRREAIVSADMQRARDASAAAAGALMMSDRARIDMERALKPPSLP